MLSASMDYQVFSGPTALPGDRLEPVGRALMLRATGPLDRDSILCQTSPTRIVARTRQEHSRVVVLDAFPTEYADSDGLRWLLALSSELATAGLPFHIVTRPHSAVRRNLDLLRAGLSLYDSVQEALRPGR